MPYRARASKFAYIVERTGLAMAGALCGLFVAAHIAHVDNALFGSIGMVFAMVVYGAIGFYVGIDTRPLLHTAAADGSASNLHQKTSRLEMLRAAGTFLAALAAVVSVYVIVFDSIPRAGVTVGVWVWWLFGATMQIVAGSIVRLFI